MSVLKHIGLKVALVAVIVLTAPHLPGAASSTEFNQFVGFGDSTMDSGYFRYNPTGGSPTIGHTAIIDALIKATVAAGGSGAFAGPGGGGYRTVGRKVRPDSHAVHHRRRWRN
jgi:outer membrane lipase/esterase